MSSNRLRRIAREIDEAASDTHSRVTLRPAPPSADDISHLEGCFHGPPDTPYEGGIYIVDIRIPSDYPFKPPQMKFKTRIWHPNVSSQTGAICLDTLSTAWSPVLTVKAALISLQGLLASPEPKDPQDAEVASMMIKNPQEFQRIARQWAIEHAGAPKDSRDSSNTGARGSDSADERGAYGRSNGHSHSGRNGHGMRQDEKSLRGYSAALVQKFTAMGFPTEKVVDAFEHAAISRDERDINEIQTEQVTARLFGEI